MHTNYLPAPGTGPLFLFVSNELSYSEFIYVLEIVNHTHTVFISIALIQMIQKGARKVFTTDAILDFTGHYLLTGFDSAGDAGFRFETVITSATGACFLISYICATEATVHSAWSDQRHANRIRLRRFSWCHVCIPAKPCMSAFVLNFQNALLKLVPPHLWNQNSFVLIIKSDYLIRNTLRISSS
jgi:hypothetical protein